MLTRFWLVRHGSNDALGHYIAGRMPNLSLNAQGQLEAARVAARLQAREIRAVYTSPLERTVETAEAIAAGRGLTPIRSDALFELDYGAWTGTSLMALREEPPWQRYNALRSTTRIPNGELMLEVQARAVSLLVELCEREPNQEVCVVSHGDVIKSIVMFALGMPLDLHAKIEIAPASLSEIVAYESQWQVLRLNDTAHLEST